MSEYASCRDGAGVSRLADVRGVLGCWRVTSVTAHAKDTAKLLEVPSPTWRHRHWQVCQTMTYDRWCQVSRPVARRQTRTHSPGTWWLAQPVAWQLPSCGPEAQLEVLITSTGVKDYMETVRPVPGVNPMVCACISRRSFALPFVQAWPRLS